MKVEDNEMDGRMIRMMDKPALARSMAPRRASTALAAVLAVVVGLGGAAAPAGAQEGGAQTQASQLEALGKRPNELFEQGKYAEALAAAEERAKVAGRDGQRQARRRHGQRAEFGDLERAVRQPLRAGAEGG